MTSEELYKKCEAKVKKIVYRNGLDGFDAPEIVYELTKLLVGYEKKLIKLLK